MGAGQKDNQFEPLTLKRRTFLPVDANQYSVMATSGELREIKAETAYEAFIKSGLKDVIKIERLSNLAGNIIEKSKFVDEQPAQVVHESLHDRILHSRNPIISAHELDELLRYSRREPEPAMNASASDVPGEAASVLPLSDLMPPSVVPQPSPEPLPQGVQSARGMDVHGDGFDEIIPASAPVKPVAAKAKPASEAHHASSAAGTSTVAADAPVEAKELSPEEVEKLLSGK